MSWISGPCSEPEEERNVVPPTDDEGIDGSSAEEPSPRFVWGQSTNFAGITDRVNPGHFVWVPKRDEPSD